MKVSAGLGPPGRILFAMAIAIDRQRKSAANTRSSSGARRTLNRKNEFSSRDRCARRRFFALKRENFRERNGPCHVQLTGPKRALLGFDIVDRIEMDVVEADVSAIPIRGRFSTTTRLFTAHSFEDKRAAAERAPGRRPLGATIVSVGRPQSNAR